MKLNLKIFPRAAGNARGARAGDLPRLQKSGGGTLKYETAPIARGNIVQHVTASGSLSAVVSVDVGSQVSGKIVALYVDFNSPVKKRPARRGN